MVNGRIWLYCETLCAHECGIVILAWQKSGIMQQFSGTPGQMSIIRDNPGKSRMVGKVGFQRQQLQRYVGSVCPEKHQEKWWLGVKRTSVTGGILVTGLIRLTVKSMSVLVEKPLNLTIEQSMGTMLTVLYSCPKNQFLDCYLSIACRHAVVYDIQLKASSMFYILLGLHTTTMLYSCPKNQFLDCYLSIACRHAVVYDIQLKASSMFYILLKVFLGYYYYAST